MRVWFLSHGKECLNLEANLNLTYLIVKIGHKLKMKKQPNFPIKVV